MSTRRFVSIIIVATVAFLIIVGSVAFATAEGNTYEVDAVVVNFEATRWGNLKVEVVDEEDNIWGYYADLDEDVHIGDVVTLTVFDYGDEEENEIIDAVRVDHLDTVEMLQWICH